MFNLPPGYKRQRPQDFDDTIEAVGAGLWTWQPEVIPFAVDLARLGGRERVIDVGCGSGEKWRPYIEEFDLTLVDREEIVDRNALPEGYLLAFDLETGDPLPETADPVDALLVCSDVIEHMVEPRSLMRTLRLALEDGAVALVLSTPARERSNWTRKNGPPRNPHHAQEWTLDELAQFLEAEGLKVESKQYTRSNDHEPDEATSLIVATA